MESVNHRLTLIRESLNALDWLPIDQMCVVCTPNFLKQNESNRFDPILSDPIRSDPIITKHQRNAQCASLNLYYFVQYCIYGTRKMHSFIIIIITHIAVHSVHIYRSVFSESHSHLNVSFRYENSMNHRILHFACTLATSSHVYWMWLYAITHGSEKSGDRARESKSLQGKY